ncbi:unnamed protein product [Paramecium primaurelia]|uniref:Uncharacterized protein n=1 Tax=Paramecium primaurelia TaxID=5886 RepID=A0A8S1M080_PARPR|nr:unnamed protein product [Paramecium primaurelia]
MKSGCNTIKNDQEYIKEIHSKWRNSDIKQTQISQIKKLQLTFTEQKNLDFQLPDVFITTKQINTNPQKIKKIKKIPSLSFDQNMQTNVQSKQQRIKELSTIQAKYYKFKDLSCSVRTTPQQDNLNKSLSIPKNENLYEIDGTKFPYGLYTMHKKRRDQIQDLFHNQNSQRSKKIFSDYEDSRINQSDQVNKENKQKEYTSRSFLDNAYYSIICAKKNCKYRIKIKIRDSLPKESRFQQC